MIRVHAITDGSTDHVATRLANIEDMLKVTIFSVASVGNKTLLVFSRDAAAPWKPADEAPLGVRLRVWRSGPRGRGQEDAERSRHDGKWRTLYNGTSVEMDPQPDFYTALPPDPVP